MVAAVTSSTHGDRRPDRESARRDRERRSPRCARRLENSTENSTQTIAGLTDNLRIEIEASAAVLRSAAEGFDGQFDASDRRPDRPACAAKWRRPPRPCDRPPRNSTTNSTRAIIGLTDRLRADAEQSGAQLRDAVERSAAASVSALGGTGDTAAQRTVPGARPARRREHDPRAHRRLGGRRSRRGRRSASPSGSPNFSARSARFRRRSPGSTGRRSATQAEASGLVERLAEHTNSLAGVAHDLTAAQETVDAALERRRESLQTLMGQIGRKSEDFESLMRSFAGTVEESFNKAQARAKEINAALMLTTNGAAATVSSQFEMIRDNAGKERERTAAALQTAYDQANTQLAGVMNQITERFKQSAAERAHDGRRNPARTRSHPAGTAPRRPRIAAARPPSRPARCAASSATRSRR